MRSHDPRGFTLIELAFVVLLLGILIGFSVPAFSRLARSNNLHGAAENMASRLRLARQQAMATGVDQHVHLVGAFVGYDYLVHPLGTGVTTYYSLPTGVDYAPSSFAETFSMEKAGRSSMSVSVPLTNGRGDTATVIVDLTGLVTVY